MFSGCLPATTGTKWSGLQPVSIFSREGGRQQSLLESLAAHQGAGLLVWQLSGCPLLGQCWS